MQEPQIMRTSDTKYHEKPMPPTLLMGYVTSNAALSPLSCLRYPDLAGSMTGLCWLDYY